MFHNRTVHYYSGLVRHLANAPLTLTCTVLSLPLSRACARGAGTIMALARPSGLGARPAGRANTTTKSKLRAVGA
eukprot:3338271-Pyramimonas_sp.AAC.1